MKTGLSLDEADWQKQQTEGEAITAHAEDRNRNDCRLDEEDEGREGKGKERGRNAERQTRWHNCLIP